MGSPFSAARASFKASALTQVGSDAEMPLNPSGCSSFHNFIEAVVVLAGHGNQRATGGGEGFHGALRHRTTLAPDAVDLGVGGQRSFGGKLSLRVSPAGRLTAQDRHLARVRALGNGVLPAL